MNADIQKPQCVNPELGELLFAYGLDMLGADEAAAFEDHLMECPFCRSELEAGLAAFTALREHEPDLVQQMKASGEDYASMLARLRDAAEPARPRMADSLRDRWRRALDAVLNPWVYGPLVTATAAIILIVHLTGRRPELTMPLPPQAHVQDLSRLRAPDMIPPAAKLLPSQTVQKQAESSAPVPEPLADQEIMTQQTTLSMKMNAAAPAPPSPSAESLSELQESAMPPVPQVQPLAVPSEEAVPHSAAVERALALLKNPPPPSEAEVPELQTGVASDFLDRKQSLKADPNGGSPIPQAARITATDSTHPSPLARGLTAYQYQDYAAASSWLAAAARGNSADSTTWFYLGVSRLQLKQWTPAVEALNKADSLAGGRDPRSRYYLALATILNGDPAKGRALLEGLSARRDSLGINAAELERLLGDSAKPK